MKLRSKVVFLWLIAGIAFMLIFNLKRPRLTTLNTHVVMQFEKDSIGGLSGEYFQIDLLPDKNFSKPIKIFQLNPLPDDIYGSQVIKKAVLDVLRKEGIEHFYIVDISRDRNWIALYCKILEPKTGLSESKLKYKLYIIHVPTNKVEYVVSYPGSFHFSDDSVSCFLGDLVEIKHMNLNTKNHSTIFDGGRFFITLDKLKKMIIFTEGQILLKDLKMSQADKIGTYHWSVFDVGRINDEWAYLITTQTKTWRTNLYFLHLDDYRVIKYPYEIPMSRVVRILRTPLGD